MVSGFNASGMTPLEEMDEDSLRRESQQWRNLWSWLPEDVKEMVLKSGQLCRVITRGNKAHVGLLTGIRFDLVGLDLQTQGEERDWESGRRWWEDKTVRVPLSSLLHVEFISDREEVIPEQVEVEEMLSEVVGQQIEELGG